MIDELKLKHTWHVGQRIGGGGFGQVYEATNGIEAAVKFVPKAPGADRELLFVDLGEARNIIPIIDSGETDEHWVLVMPRAEKSLRDHLESPAGRLSQPEIAAILEDIIVALVDLEVRDVVHRDLKPENVLLLDGHWCLSDFGISRYAEATTAPDTKKHAMSFPYAAPERWRAERATSAVDVYAFGVLAYELLTGTLPFPGPAIEDYREQHLHQDARPLGEHIPQPLAALVLECLYKAPGARPRPANVGERLKGAIAAPASEGLGRLQQAHRRQISRRAEEDRRRSEAQTASERRDELAATAIAAFKSISEVLKGAIVSAAPSVDLSEHGDGWTIGLGEATLHMDSPSSVSSNPWGYEGRVSMDVVVAGQLDLETPRDAYGRVGRSHSLWYCDATEAGHYGWYETAFMFNPLMHRQSEQEPFALEPGAEASEALFAGVGSYQVAWAFTPLVLGELDAFVDRWATWFGEAADEAYQYPTQLPERPSQGSWRRD